MQIDMEKELLYERNLEERIARAMKEAFALIPVCSDEWYWIANKFGIAGQGDGLDAG